MFGRDLCGDMLCTWHNSSSHKGIVPWEHPLFVVLYRKWQYLCFKYLSKLKQLWKKLQCGDKTGLMTCDYEKIFLSIHIVIVHIHMEWIYHDVGVRNIMGMPFRFMSKSIDILSLYCLFLYLSQLFDDSLHLTVI